VTTRARFATLAFLALALGFGAAPARAQLTVPGKGAGSFTVTFQTVTDHYHLDYQGNLVAAGHIKAHSAQLRLDYGLTDRLALNVTAPFVTKRYQGAFPHNPDPYEDDHAAFAALSVPGTPVDPAHEGESITRLDDGDFHGGWQDWGVGLRWQWRTRPWMVTPFVNYNQPMRDYTWFAHAAPGTRQRRLALGVAVGRQFGPRFPKLYVQGQYSYTFVEKVQDISVNTSTLNTELGYFFTPRWSGRVFATFRKTHGGLDFPIDFPPPRTTELFLHHDQIQRVDYVNAGLGVGYRINDHWSVNGNWMTTVWGENGHAIHNAVSLGITRSFD
jgi:hypothetical protein